jgi:sulfonate transport system permease protein
MKLLGLSFFLLTWEIIIRNTDSIRSLIPAPSDLPKAFWRELESGYIISSLLYSSTHTFIGIFSGSLLGIVWGLLVSRSKTLKLFISPVLALLRPIPPIAWVPFSLVIFGSGTGAAIFIVGVGVFWTTFITTTSAVDAINPNLLELAEVYNIKRPDHLLLKIILPASLPSIMGGIRTALGQGWSLVVAAELLGVPGMGQRMWEAAGVLANEVVVVYMLIIALAFSLSDFLFVQIDRRVFRWRNL